MTAQDRTIWEDKAQRAAKVVGEKIDLSFIPNELVSICVGVVRAHHEGNGYRELMKDLTHKETMVCILVHRDLRDLMGGMIAFRRLNIVSLAVCGILLIAAIIWGAWIALGIIPCMVIACYMGKQYREAGMLIAGILLALEMINDDLVGSSKYLPHVWRAAYEKIQTYFPNEQTRFLDIYIPGRNDLDQIELQKLIKEGIIRDV